MDGYIRIDNKTEASPTITLSQSQFDDLLEYSMSYPTGTTYGKKWKAKEKNKDGSLTWFLGEYYDIGKEKKVGVRWRIIQILEAPKRTPPPGRSQLPPERTPPPKGK